MRNLSDPVARRFCWLTGAVLLFASRAFAYGGFTGGASDYTRAYWIFLKGSLFFLIPYLVFSLALESMKTFIVPCVAYWIYLFCGAPELIVMGETGPAHVAVPAISNLAFLLSVVFLVKYCTVCTRYQSLVRQRVTGQNEKASEQK